MAQLVVDGVIQSILPPPDWGYWKHMVPEVEPKRVLMLGVGLGTTASIIKEKWPGVEIVGVDIETQQPEVIKRDAFDYIEDCDKTFDLILVDLWKGGWYPTQVFKLEFMGKLRKLLNPGGRIFINAPNIDKCAQLNNLKVRAEEGESIVYETA